MSISYKVIIVLAMFICSSCSRQEPDIEKDTANIEALLAQQLVDWNNGDIEAFMQTYWDSETLRFSSRGGTAYGWNNVLDMYKRSFPDRESMGQLHFDIDTIFTNRYPMVQVNGAFHLYRSDTLEGPFSLFFEKIDSEWKITEDHTW
ncbi:MAG: hypothetical protein JXR19_09045 [Bacteroidia bacterium]